MRRSFDEAPVRHAGHSAVARHDHALHVTFALAPQRAQDFHRAHGGEAAGADLPPRLRALRPHRPVHRQQRQIALAQFVICRAHAGNHQRAARAQLRIGQQLALGHARPRRNRAIPVDILRGQRLAFVLFHFFLDAGDQILPARAFAARDDPRKIVQPRAGHIHFFFLQPQIERQPRAGLLRHAAHAEGAHAAEALRRLARAGERQPAVSARAEDQRRAGTFLAHLIRQIADETDRAHGLHRAAEAAAQANLLAQPDRIQRFKILLPRFLVEEIRTEDHRVGGKRRLLQLGRVIESRLHAEGARQRLRPARGKLRHVEVGVHHPIFRLHAEADKQIFENRGGKEICPRASDYDFFHGFLLCFG